MVVTTVWDEPLVRLLVFRATQALHLADVEVVLSGQHGPEVMVFAVPVDAPTPQLNLVDVDVAEPSVYAVIGVTDTGDLVALPCRTARDDELLSVIPLAPLPERPYEHFPALVYRQDDPTGQLAMRGMARSLLQSQPPVGTVPHAHPHRSTD